MGRGIKIFIIFNAFLMIGGCTTTNSIPYKASTSNVIVMQDVLSQTGNKVAIGSVSMSPEISDAPNCRLNGPIRVAPGKSLAEYVEEALVEELFLARVYDPSSPLIIDAVIEEAKFSSVTPAAWDISMSVNSSSYQGYSVSVFYQFKTSWDAFSACQNVADAFGPAVQALLGKLVTHPEFPLLVH